MKSILLCITGLLSTIVLYSQTETLLSKPARWGGFGGPIVEMSNINGDPIVDVGGGGGLMISDFFVGAYGMGSDAGVIAIDDINHDLSFGHGGLWLGYSYNAGKLLHPYVSLRMGGGELSAETNNSKYEENFFAMSPELGIELNIATWFKLAACAGYRWTNIDDNGIPGIANDEVNSLTGSLTFRFGFFNEK